MQDTELNALKRELARRKNIYIQSIKNETDQAQAAFWRGKISAMQDMYFLLGRIAKN